MPPLASSLEDDSDAHLSDLDDDIKEYIATKKEVSKMTSSWLLSFSLHCDGVKGINSYLVTTNDLFVSRI